MVGPMPIFGHLGAMGLLGGAISPLTTPQMFFGPHWNSNQQQTTGRREQRKEGGMMKQNQRNRQ